MLGPETRASSILKSESRSVDTIGSDQNKSTVSLSGKVVPDADSRFSHYYDLITVSR